MHATQSPAAGIALAPLSQYAVVFALMLPTGSPKRNKVQKADVLS